ncbi:MAG TPA: gamma-glutamyl-gamma-aminobutyrate hydrolase family protein [Methylibium sp.]|nr:gamma-glutamyl-gamma-aminobutyrate hydrolase family protein [Methylibium sp.]
MNRPETLPLPQRPVVLVPACNRMVGHHPFHIVGQKYVDAVRLAGCLPLVVPAARGHEVDELLALADGVFLTGSPSNVHPRHFDEVVHDTTLPLDPVRDDWTLPLVPRVLELGIPLFAICRGFQETNVALGGSLHQAVQEQPGLLDHRSDDQQSIDIQYGPAHPVKVVPGGLLETLLGESEFKVNSLHGQGVKRLAERLRAEALAPDGVIEAFTAPAAPGFNLGVQWHPEWQARDNPVSMKLLRAFGDACRAYREVNRETARERPRVP